MYGVDNVIIAAVFLAAAIAVFTFYAQAVRPPVDAAQLVRAIATAAPGDNVAVRVAGGGVEVLAGDPCRVEAAEPLIAPAEARTINVSVERLGGRYVYVFRRACAAPVGHYWLTSGYTTVYVRFNGTHVYVSRSPAP